jgi:hypothetical protein
MFSSKYCSRQESPTINKKAPASQQALSQSSELTSQGINDIRDAGMYQI